MKTFSRAQDKDEILGRLRRVGPDSVRRWGRMTAHQMICHVGDAYRMGTGDVRVSDATSLAQRTLIKWIALYVPLRWPPGILTRPEIDQVLGGGTIPSDFSADRARAISYAEAFAARAGARDWPAHPIFGRMSEAAWMRWGYLHADHHLRQFGH
jgi:Protein of unknown function (DUF1569)